MASDVEIAIMRYNPAIHKMAKAANRRWGGYVETDELVLRGMELFADYVRTGKLAKWEQKEKPDRYIAIVLLHDLLDHAEKQCREIRKQRGKRPGFHAGRTGEAPSARTLRRYRQLGVQPGAILTRRPLTKDEKRRVAELHAQGLGARAIAGMMARERDTVRYWTRKMDRGEVITDGSDQASRPVARTGL